MRLIFVVVILTLVILTANAQVDLKVRPSEQISRRHVTWSTSWGSYNSVTSRSEGINISLFNMAPNEQTYVIRCTFFGFQDTYSENIPVTLGRCGSFKTNIVRRPVVQKDENYAALGQRYISGGKPDGYLVVVLQDDKIIAAVKDGKTITSQEALDDLSQSDGQQTKSQQTDRPSSNQPAKTADQPSTFDPNMRIQSGFRK